MTSIQALRHKLDQMKAALPQTNLINAQDWQAIRAIIKQTVASYPCAERAVHLALAGLDDRPVRETAFRALTQALWPYMDARVAIAEELMRYEEHQRATA